MIMGRGWGKERWKSFLIQLHYLTHQGFGDGERSLWLESP